MKQASSYVQTPPSHSPPLAVKQESELNPWKRRVSNPGLHHGNAHPPTHPPTDALAFIPFPDDSMCAHKIQDGVLQNAIMLQVNHRWKLCNTQKQQQNETDITNICI